MTDTWAWRNGNPIRTVERIELDLTPQKLYLDIPEDKSYSIEEPEILATCGRLSPNTFVSAGIIANKAKQFDDGLYAAVELLTQSGTPRVLGKKMFLKQLESRLALAGNDTARAFIIAAKELGGERASTPVSPTVATNINHAKTQFLSDELKSKPISFYTWSQPLVEIWQQDRYLQSQLPIPVSSTLQMAISSDPALGTFYKAYLALVSKLTNPFAKPSLLEPVSDESRVFPPSIAPETELAKQLFSNAAIPPGFSLMDELIKRVQSGMISLEPKATSGWYEHCLWAIECLLKPDSQMESSKVFTSITYRKELVDLFKSLMALTRETHIKQLEIPLLGCCFSNEQPVIKVRPKLSIEPLATFYQRRANSYKMVRSLLLECFTEDDLKLAHRMKASGPVKMDLFNELNYMVSLFEGLSQIALIEIGMNAPSSSAKRPQARINSYNRCKNAHPLVPCTMSQLRSENPSYKCYVCDVCKITSTAEPVLHCGACTFDVCPNCYPTCNAGHPLLLTSKTARITYHSGQANGFNCDSCKQPKQDNFDSYCRFCDFDVCETCSSSSARAGSSGSPMELARSWLKHISKDEDLTTDNRMMVPVFFDLTRKMTKVWCVLGYSSKTLQVQFRAEPKLLTHNAGIIKFEDAHEEYIYPVFAELYTRKILDRREFRRLCDRLKTFSKITAAIQS